MPRQYKKTKPLIYVFCEGESEQAYTEFLKRTFSDVAVIKYPSATGIFETANEKFHNDKKYKENAEITDEIWFFFDAEKKDADKWKIRSRIIQKLRKLKSKPYIKIRLLMTTGCIEYWLMLHYKMYAPVIESVSDKENILKEVIKNEPTYKKGDFDATAKIAQKYPTAVRNSDKILENLLSEGLPETEDTDRRNEWLYTTCKTFSTVFEAINYLESL